MCSLLKEDEDKDNQVFVVFQYHAVMDTESQVTARVIEQLRLLNCKNLKLLTPVYVHTYIFMLT